MARWMRLSANALAVLLLMAAGASSSMSIQTKAGQALGDDPSTDPPVDIQGLRELGCPQGLEHFLPGIYYYCVGARDLLLNKDAGAIDMLKIAASWGSKPAQLTLGVGYYNGDVIGKDHVLGLAWLGLAAERGDPNYRAIFKSAWQKASPTERQQASALYKSMLPTYGDQRAARRAFRRYQYERDQLLRDQTLGARVCIAGLTGGSIESPDPGTYNNDCSGSQSTALVAKKVDAFASSLLDGWEGHVMVGSAEAVAAPASQVGPAGK